MSQLNWKATERWVTTPGPYSDQALANVRLRLSAGEEPTAETVRHIESVAEWDRLSPELFIHVDTPTLAADTKLKPNDILISVIVRDRELSRFEVVQSWPLSSLPSDSWSLDQALQRFSRSVRLDVIVVATPNVSKANGKSASMPAAAILATKAFKIRTPRYALDFPFRIVEPKEMEQQGLDANTVCYVHWRGQDVQRAPSDLLEVWLNKEFEDKFTVISRTRPVAAADYIGRSIAAHVYAEILANVLNSEEDSDEPASLVYIVKKVIEQELGMTLDVARNMYTQGPEGRSKLMPWSQKLTNASGAFAKLTF